MTDAVASDPQQLESEEDTDSASSYEFHDDRCKSNRLKQMLIQHNSTIVSCICFTANERAVCEY